MLPNDFAGVLLKHSLEEKGLTSVEKYYFFVDFLRCFTIKPFNVIRLSDFTYKAIKSKLSTGYRCRLNSVIKNMQCQSDHIKRQLST
jgi:hypothetical protein